MKRENMFVGMICTVFMTFLISVPVNAEILWDGDAQYGVAVFERRNVEANSEVTVMDDPEYGKVFRFYKPAGDNRCEYHSCKDLDGNTLRWPSGSIYYIGWRCKVDMPSINTTLNCCYQSHGYGSGMTADHPLVIKPINGNLVFEHYGVNERRTRLWSVPMESVGLNTWFSVVLLIRMHPSEGYVEFWFNSEKQQVDNKDRFYGLTLDGEYTTNKFGVYGARDHDVTVWIGQLKMATTYDEVRLDGITSIRTNPCLQSKLSYNKDRHQKIHIFDVSGRQVREMQINDMDWVWDGLDLGGMKLARGVYCILQTGMKKKPPLLIRNK